jgi:uroporphyrinogen-III synthase
MRAVICPPLKTMPEQSLPVIVTRTMPGAVQTGERLTALSLKPVLSPALELSARNEALPDLSTIEGLIFTSANGVRFFADATTARNHATWCVGPATASEALSEGFSPVHQSSGDAADLARYITHHWSAGRPRRLLHVANSATSGIVKSALEAEGFTVIFSPLYETRPAASLTEAAETVLAAREPYLLLIHSAKGADAFVSLAGKNRLQHARPVVISQQAAGPLQAAGLRNIAVAGHPDEDHLMATLQRVLAAG